MYDLYKKKSAENVNKKWQYFGLEISSNITNEINSYIPVKKLVLSLTNIAKLETSNHSGFPKIMKIQMYLWI